MIKNISILGAGGHAKVIIESALLNGFSIDSLYDDTIKVNSYLGLYQIKGPIDENLTGNSIIAIGDNKIRKNICSHCYRINWVTVTHPSAIISIDVRIGDGTVIMAGVVLQSGTKIGKHCIINTKASIDHDCIIDDFVHISPSVTLCGNVVVGEGTHVGAAATIIPNIKIGKWCVIGAGAVITKDVPDHSLVVGVPGKIIKSLENE
jgi:sugar O-acyltransferase (sialic acid O-acetyltransferase NeuD family)